jgi:hypothetical protein
MNAGSGAERATGAQRPAPTDPDRRRVGRSLTVLRIGVGLVWSLNFLYVIDPANLFFPTFSATALGFGGSALGGALLPAFVADHASVFAVLVAAGTGYLALAFLLGATTRIACVVGAVFNAFLLVTQVGGLLTIPGGTDIGPQPLYLLVYAALFVGAGLDALSIDRWWATTRAARRARPSDLAARTPSA